MKVTSFSIQTSPMNGIDFGTLLTTIFVDDIVPANTDERIVAEGVL
jgi:hypothetical protein